MGSVSFGYPYLSLNFAGANYFVAAGYSRTNYFLNASSPATQTITLPVGNYTLNITGSGSAAVAAGTATITGAGTATAGAWVKFTVTVAGTITVTITGSPTTVQVGNGNYPTTFINTGAAAVSVTTYISNNPADVGNLTYTRAGTAYSLDGTIAFADNVPRIVPGQGYLAEPSATNLQTYSNAIGGTNWIANNATVVLNNSVAPDGSTTASRITTSALAGGYFSASISVIAGTTYTASAYFKYVSGNPILQLVATGSAPWGGAGADRFVAFNAQTGAFVSKSTEITNYSIIPAWNGGYRVSATYTPTTTTAINASATYSNVASATVFDTWGFQQETGAAPTSLVATLGTSVTRPADVGYYTLSSSLSGAYSLAAVGSFGAANAVQAFLAQLDDGTPNNRVTLQTDNGFGGTAAVTSSASVIQANVSGNIYTQNQPIGMAVRVALNDVRIATNGNLGGLSTSAALPATPLTRLQLGAGTGNPLNGTLKSAAIYSSALSDAEVIYRSQGNLS